MPIDLVALVPLDPPWGSLDAFVGACLCDGGIWKSPRTSDGIQGLSRVLARGPDTLRVCGRIYEIDQTVHPFWLELYRDASGHQVSWLLYFDVASLIPRRARGAVDSCEDPDSIDWIARLAGEAWGDHDVLALVPGSTRVLVRDDTERTPPRLDRGHRRDG
jgi:hypothetical protein